MKNFDLEEVKNFIRIQSEDSKVYLGSDSVRMKSKGVWYSHFTTVVVVHIGGNHGCKIFGEFSTERDYDQKKNRPSIRLMQEVQKVSEMFMKLSDVLEDRYVEVHLDINPDEKFGSSCVLNQAIGYIRGVCNVVPMVKPDAFAASYAADRLCQVVHRGHLASK